MVNYDGTPKLPGTKQKTTAKKVQIRWTPDMKAHLTSLVRIKKPHMKDNTKEGKIDEKKAWLHVQSGLLCLIQFQYLLLLHNCFAMLSIPPVLSTDQLSGVHVGCSYSLARPK
jgi:hypothetical protein